MSCYYTSHTNNKTLKVTIHFRDGTKAELSEDVLVGSGDTVNKRQISGALRTLQSRTNNALTALVEKEKESAPANGQKNNMNEENDADEDDDDEDSEPPQKQQKR